jgi:hypothetical protein
MATKDIPDVEVVKACRDWRASLNYDALSLLMDRTGQSEKACLRALERGVSRGLADYGVSLRTAWPTPAGIAILEGR